MCHKHEQPALAAGARGEGGRCKPRGEECCKPRGVLGQEEWSGDRPSAAGHALISISLRFLAFD